MPDELTNEEKQLLAAYRENRVKAEQAAALSAVKPTRRWSVADLEPSAWAKLSPEERASVRAGILADLGGQ
jgi:hypothetical protein